MPASQTVSLGEDALRFVEDKLKEGLSLSQLVHHRLELRSGSLQAFLPLDADISSVQNRSAEDFRWGGVTKTGGSLEILTSFVSSYLNSLPDSICIFEYANARSTDLLLQCEKPGVLTFGLEVYYAATQHDGSSDVISAVINDTDSLWTHVGFLAVAPGHITNGHSAVLALEDLESIADGVEHIIVGAFDGEGYLIWSKIP